MMRKARLPNRIPRHHIFVYVLYLLVAIAITYPVITSLSTQFLGGDTSDAYEMARHVWWIKTAVQTGQDIFYQSNLGYPEGFSGVTLWANPLQFFPMWVLAFFLPLASAYNITILLTMALNGWAMYYLVRDRLGHRHHVPAFIAGLIFTIFPTFQGHLFDGHAGLMVQWAVPLLIHALYHLMATGERKWFGLSVVFFFLSPSGHMLQAIYVTLPLMVMFLLDQLHKRNYVNVWRLVSVSAVGGIALFIYLLPVIGETLNTAQYTQAGGYIRYSVDLLGVVSPSPQNNFWRNITTYSGDVVGLNLAEGSSYIGVIGGFLAIFGAIFRKQSRFWLGVVIVAWILALGPVLKAFDHPVVITVAGYESIVPLPFAMFIDLPIFELARTPGRFMFLFTVGFALLTGYGMAVIWEYVTAQIRPSRLKLRYIWILVLCILIFRDYQFFDVDINNDIWEEFPTRPAGIPQAIADLSQRGEIRAIYDAPYNNLLAAKEALYLQTAHGKDLIAGQVSRETPVDPARLALLQTFETPLLTDAGADIVIIHKMRADQMGQLEGLMESARVHLGEPFYEDDDYALFETPILTAQPEAYYATTPIETPTTTYIYKEQPGWIEYSATLNANNRTVHIALNGDRLHTWTVDGETEISLPLPIGRRGYNTVTIELDPPCPQQIINAVVMCRNVSLSNINVQSLTNGPIYDPIRFDDGIELSAFYMPQDIDDILSVRLWWQFNQVRSENDIRFIHVLDANRRLMAQDDDNVGSVSGDLEWTETVTLDLKDLPPGEYMVLTGWYALPDAIRYNVLTNVDGAQDNTVVLGRFTIPED